MADLKITGKLTEIKAPVYKTEKFTLNEAIIEEEGEHGSPLLFQFSSKMSDSIGGFNEGDKVTGSFNLRGRKWTSPQGEVKVFNSLECWKMEKG